MQVFHQQRKLWAGASARARRGFTLAFKTILTALAVVTITAVVLLWYAQRRWDATTADAIKRLRSSATPSPALVYTPAELACLPAPAARYFRAVLSDGQPIITRARIHWVGEFNLGKPGTDKWVPLTAVQEVVPRAPGFVWDARMTMVPGMTVRVRDALVDSEGSMRAAIFGLVPTAEARSSPMSAAAALQRYMAEATWLPTALLPNQGVSWTPIDDTHARATLRGGPVTASVEFGFGSDNLIHTIAVPDRWFDDGKTLPRPRQWQGRNFNFETQHGVKVPSHAVAEWLLPGGPYAYWRGQPTLVAYEYATAHG